MSMSAINGLSVLGVFVLTAVMLTLFVVLYYLIRISVDLKPTENKKGDEVNRSVKKELYLYWACVLAASLFVSIIAILVI